MADESGKVAFFLAGLGLGTVVGLLFAPRSGEETREFLSHKAEEGREFINRKSRDVRHQAEEFVHHGKDAIARQREHFEAAVEAGKRAYQEAGGGLSAETEPPAKEPWNKEPSGS
jgi:gas vesicle protein